MDTEGITADLKLAGFEFDDSNTEYEASVMQHPVLYAESESYQQDDANVEYAYYNNAIWFVVENFEYGVSTAEEDWVNHCLKFFKALYNNDYKTMGSVSTNG